MVASAQEVVQGLPRGRGVEAGGGGKGCGMWILGTSGGRGVPGSRRLRNSTEPTAVEGSIGLQADTAEAGRAAVAGFT